VKEKKMTDAAITTAAPTPAAGGAGKVAKKRASGKPKKATGDHPKYSAMIKDALTALKERGGSSRQAILKYIVKHYKLGGEEKIINSHLKLALRAGVKNHTLKQSKGSGAAGSFRIGEKKTEKKPKAKKPKAVKAKKARKPKAAGAAKAKKPRSPKKAGSKPKKAAGAAKPKAVKPKTKKPKATKAARPKSPKVKKAKAAARPKKAAAKK